MGHARPTAGCRPNGRSVPPDFRDGHGARITVTHDRGRQYAGACQPAPQILRRSAIHFVVCACEQLIRIHIFSSKWFTQGRRPILTGMNPGWSARQCPGQRLSLTNTEYIRLSHRIRRTRAAVLSAMNSPACTRQGRDNFLCGIHGQSHSCGQSGLRTRCSRQNKTGGDKDRICRHTGCG